MQHSAHCRQLSCTLAFMTAAVENAEEAGQMLIPEFEVRYPDWKSLNNIPGIVARFYEQSR